MATKLELIEFLAAEAGTTKAAARRMVKGFEKFINETLVNDDHLILHGFGTFYAADKKARKGRNPRTGADIQIPAKRLAKFRQSKSFKI